MDTNKIGYWVSTGLLCALFAFSTSMYFMNYDEIAAHFPELGFPSWVVIPLAIAKVLGIIALLSNRSRMLTEWAYAGFFFDTLLAFGAHHFAQDGEGAGAIIGIVLVIVSRFFYSRYRGV